MNKVLITGASGFVGANLTRRLLQEGYETHCLVRQQEISWRLADIANDITIHIADLKNFDAIQHILQSVRPQHIFHLATAGVYQGKTALDSKLFETNVMGLINLLTAAHTIPYTSFINTGSSSEYGIADIPMREDMPMNPVTVYGISKLAATQYATLHALQYKKPVITLRLFSPYGPYDFFGRFMAETIVHAFKNKPLQLGNPKSCRDYIYIDDVVDAYLRAMIHAEEMPGAVYNIGSGIETSIETALKEIQRACRSECAVSWDTTKALRPGESPRWQADITKAKQLLGWAPKTSLSSGLEKTAKWFRMNMSRYELYYR